LFPDLLFPDMDQPDVVAETEEPLSAGADAERTSWGVGDDVRHPEFGHGWVQGAGHGVMTVRFETRGTGPGVARTFTEDDPALVKADPVMSLDWPGDSAEPGDRGGKI
jgi:DNA polymerase-4